MQTTSDDEPPVREHALSTANGKGCLKVPTLYSVKIVNPNNTGGEVIIKDLEIQERPTSVEALKTKLCELFSKYTEGCDNYSIWVHHTWPWNKR